MIDWIHARCTVWGRQMRWMHFGKDGWPSRTLLGRLQDEGIVGGASSRLSQYVPEVLTPDAIELNNAFKRLRDYEREILFVHYVVVGRGKEKARVMGIAKPTYYHRLDRAQHHIWRLLLTPLDQKAENSLIR